MEKKFLVNFLFLFTAFFLILPITAQAINLCSWRGYANKSGTFVNTTDYIAVYNGTKAYNATIYSYDGFYIADVQVDSTNDDISFKICGVDADQGAQTWPCSDEIQYATLNLSITALANNAACSYSCACTGNGHCCSGATEYTDGSGTGNCQAAACAAATTTTRAPSGGGPGGGGIPTTTTTTLANVTTTTTTTTTLPPKEETQSVGSIPENETSNFTFTETIVTGIEVTAGNDMSGPQITVTQSSSEPAAFIIGVQNVVYGYLTIEKTNFTDADISSVKIRFKIEKTWLSENRIDESSVVLSRYWLGVWTDLETTKIGDDGTWVYFEAISPGLSYFAITGVQRPIPTFWEIITYIDNYYLGEITFWTLLDYISDYYSG